MMNSLLTEEITQSATVFPLKEKLAGKRFLVTGATGLIGMVLVRFLTSLGSGVKIYAPVRNLKKAQDIFGSMTDVVFAEGNLEDFDYSRFGEIDYIIHGAAPTSSKFFVESPVETINSITLVTNHLLEYASRSHVSGMVFLSSLEVYGQILEEFDVSEDTEGKIDAEDVRSSYPLAKRLAENLCCAYAAEYNVPVSIARLTQTTGPGIAPDDNRVIAQFVRKATGGEDIVLHTSGLSARPYCYTLDAVRGILYILLLGERGKAYNVANEDTYISARDLAAFVRDTLNPGIEVRAELNENMGYAPVTYLRLSTARLESLGWKPEYGLKEIVTNLSRYLGQ